MGTSHCAQLSIDRPERKQKVSERGGLDNYIVNPETGCWEWQGRLLPTGYASVNRKGHMLYVHRLWYERAHGSIPDGLTIDHLCRNPSCCNPDHLEAVTLQENIRRGVPFRLKSHCKHGHSLADVYISGTGKRRCRQCSLRGSAAGYQRRKLQAASAAPLTPPCAQTLSCPQPAPVEAAS